MKALRKLLWPFSPLYAAVVYLRNLCYDRGWCPSVAFETPVLCVGNLSVGGSGKTPMVEWLLSFYAGRRRVAVLSRGYRRSSRGFIQARADSTAADLGDEPLQLARKFPQAIVAVDANRVQGITRLLETEAPELIILDDGFQHRRVRPKYNLLLTAWEALYPDQGYLPSGDLRDHKSQARRADLIIVTKCPEDPGPEERARLLGKLKPLPHQQVVFATLAYDLPRGANGQAVSWESLGSGPLTLVTGIARPQPLLDFLHQKGISFTHRRFPDHHSFTRAEIEAFNHSGPVLTTEKDAVRLDGRVANCYVLGVRHQFGTADRAVLEAFLESV